MAQAATKRDNPLMSWSMNIGDLQRAAGVITWAAVTGFCLYFALLNDHAWAPALAIAIINLASWIHNAIRRAPLNEPGSPIATHIAAKLMIAIPSAGAQA